MRLLVVERERLRFGHYSSSLDSFFIGSVELEFGALPSNIGGRYLSNCNYPHEVKMVPPNEASLNIACSSDRFKLTSRQMVAIHLVGHLKNRQGNGASEQFISSNDS